VLPGHLESQGLVYRLYKTRIFIDRPGALANYKMQEVAYVTEKFKGLIHLK
jgi:hypothetical protein